MSVKFLDGTAIGGLRKARGAGASSQAEGNARGRWWLSGALGAALVLLGGSVMLGWWLQLPALVRVLPSFTPMVFNTALSFVLAGGALLASFSDLHLRSRVGAVLGGLLAVLAASILAEHALQLDLGIDWARMHGWLDNGDSSPGRTSAPTAAAFLLAAAALFLAPRVRRPWEGTLARGLILGVGAIGLLALAGYAVNAPALFPQYVFGQVALHTSGGLLLLAFGLRAFSRRFEWGRKPIFERENDRITAVGAVVLVGTALIAGIATFAILQDRVQTLVRDELLVSLARRADIFQDLIELREVNARIAATRPAAMRNIRAIHAGRDDGSHIANVRAVVDSFVKQGFSAIAYADVDGKIVASGGRFAAAPAATVALATRDKAELLWDDGFVIRHRIPMRDADGNVGALLAEQPLPVLTRMARQASGRGETWDMGLCVRRGEQLLCFPQRLNPRVFTAPLANSAGEALPMTRALRGETGTVITRDYRSQNVVAAYGPLGPLGLGMVLKVDTAEVFGAIREQLQLAAGLLLAVAAAGTLLLRYQVRPLAARLEGALEERAAGLHRAQQVAKLAHVITRPDGSFETWSETLPQLIGVDDAGMPRRTRDWLHLLHPEDRALFRSQAIEAGATGVRTEVEYRLRRSDGEWIHVQQTMEPLGGESGGHGRLRWFNTLQDVTEKRRSEEVLRQSEHLKAAILEASLDALITIDHQGKIVEFNPAADAMFGIPRERALGQSMAELIIPPRLRERHERGIAHFLATGTGPVLGKRIEIEALRADGTEFPVELAITPITSQSTPMFTGFVRDITQRRESERSIKRLNRVYAVLSGVNSMIVRIRDRDELFREACRIAVDVGKLRMALIGLVEHDAQRIRTVADAGDDPEFARLDRPLGPAGAGAKEGGSSRAVRSRLPVIINDVRADSSAMSFPGEALKRGYHSVAAFPLIVGESAIGVLLLFGGEPGYFDAEEVKLLQELASDIAYAVEHLDLDLRVRQRTVELNRVLEDLRKSEAELEQRVAQRTAELEAANKELEAFSYSVSHDLRAPLRHIDGFAQMLHEDCAPALDASGRRYLGVITESVRHMGQLIDDLLLFSKMGRAEMHQAQVSMDELVREAVTALTGEIGERSIEWRIEPLPEVRGDRAMLKQVWANLLSNAVKYTRPRPLAKIRVGYEKAAGEFYVQDNGAGFDMAYAGKLFSVFQRLHRAEEFEGTGVGLANVRRIVARHGGRVRAQGKVDEGAIFHFSLPRHEEEHA